ncbi:MAG TPA: gephyrin-like molybdotransferase Glp [Thermoanaerobaculia bacterium]|nr:gephyrin-like molybdotransferase Glp [Thermoanaerobaculia bacterium]
MANVPILSPEQAWERIAAALAPLAAEPVARRAAAGRVLAAALTATVDVPAADVSAMDGYALAGEVVPGERRPVAGTVAAGDPPGLRLPAGHALRIMTGAPLPLGADRVVPVEATRPAPRPPSSQAAAPPGMAGLGDDRGATPPLDGSTAAGPGFALDEVELLAAAGSGDHIRRRGEVQRAGQVLLPAGSLLTPGALALVATHGHAEVQVHRAPAVAVLATGDEVVPPEQEPGPGQLRDSHTDFLLAAGAALGLRFTSLGIAPDRPDALAARVAAGLAAGDVLLICGGVSMGEFDLVEGVLERLGCSRRFDAVAIQPGKPLVFATHPAGCVFGLPGNPASVMVDFWLFVCPALARLAGRQATWWPAVPATLAAPLPGAPARDRFLPAEVAWGAAPDGGPPARPLPPKGSHDLAAYAHGTALVRVRAGAPAAPAGARCEVLPLPPPL